MAPAAVTHGGAEGIAERQVSVSDPTDTASAAEAKRLSSTTPTDLASEKVASTGYTDPSREVQRAHNIGVDEGYKVGGADALNKREDVESGVNDPRGAAESEAESRTVGAATARAPVNPRDAQAQVTGVKVAVQDPEDTLQAKADLDVETKLGVKKPPED